MTTNSIIGLFNKILDNDLIISGENLKSRFYHIWKTDIPLESVCLLMPKTTSQVSEIIKVCNENNQEVVIHGGLTNLVGSTKSTNTQIVLSLEKMNNIIEVKNVTLLRDQKIAEFPDAVTERGTKHLKKLIEALKQGYKPFVLFLTQIQGINNFKIAKDIDLNYYKNYLIAKKSGVKFLAYRCLLSNKEIKIEKKINIIDE